MFPFSSSLLDSSHPPPPHSLPGSYIVSTPFLFPHHTLLLTFTTPSAPCHIPLRGHQLLLHSKTGTLLRISHRMNLKRRSSDKLGVYEEGPWDVVIRGCVTSSIQPIHWIVGFGLLAGLSLMWTGVYTSICTLTKTENYPDERYSFVSGLVTVVVAMVGILSVCRRDAFSLLGFFSCLFGRSVSVEILSTQFVSLQAKTDAGAFRALVEGPVPPRFLLGSPGDPAEARRRWEVSCHWKRDQDIAHILQASQPYFYEMKNAYPMCCHKRDKEGRLIGIERIGDLKGSMKLIKDHNISMREVLRHVAFISEFTWTHLDKRPLPNAQMLRILDVNNIGFIDVSSDFLNFIKEVGFMLGHNYPERQAIIFIINVPSFFSIVWELVKPFVRPVTQKKIRIVASSKVREELLKEIDAENLPEEYGGSCKCEGDGGCFRNSKEEKKLFEFVRNLNLTVKERSQMFVAQGAESFATMKDNAIRIGS